MIIPSIKPQSDTSKSASFILKKAGRGKPHYKCYCTNNTDFYFELKKTTNLCIKKLSVKIYVDMYPFVSVSITDEQTE